MDGLTGEHLTQRDALALLDTCGGQAPLSADAVPARLTLVSASGAAHAAGAEALVVAGGVYRLCWCAGGFVCSSAGDFKVDPRGDGPHACCACAYKLNLLSDPSRSGLCYELDTNGTQAAHERHASGSREARGRHASGLHMSGTRAAHE